MSSSPSALRPPHRGPDAVGAASGRARDRRAEAPDRSGPAPTDAAHPAPAAAVPSARSHARTRRRAALLVALAGATAAAFLAALGLGPVAIPPSDAIEILARAVTGTAEALPNALVITEIRLPRALLALLAGAGLAVAGVAMQTYFRNPLAEPGVTGVASGAAVGAVLVLVLGLEGLGAWTLPLAAILGAIGVLLLIQIVSLVSRDRGVTTVLLVGIALNAFCGAVIGALIANAEDSQTARGAMFWLQGDLTTANWRDLAIVTGPVVIGIMLLLGASRELNMLLLGEETARSAGLSARAVRAFVLVLASVVVGATVAVTGVIGFVGLVAPHIVRLLLGPDHRFLLPGAMLLGAAFLLAADTVARLAPAGTAWQTGVVTALVGSPVFLALVLRHRRSPRSTA